MLNWRAFARVYRSCNTRGGAGSHGVPARLQLGQYFLGLDQDRFGLSFDVALHIGTLVAVVSYFWRDLIRMGLAFLRSFGHRDLVDDPDQRLAYLVIASTVPAALIGDLFEGFFQNTVRSP